MPPSESKPRRHFTEAARKAAQAARTAKREALDDFGTPELFIVKAGEHAYTWELRRFGGIVLQRGLEPFDSAALARAEGERALAALRALPDHPAFRRQGEPRATGKAADG